MAKNLTAMEEIPVRSLGGEDPLEKGISLLLRSFNGPEPGGPESTNKKVKETKRLIFLVYAESPWHGACSVHRGLRRPLDGVNAQSAFSRGS